MKKQSTIICSIVYFGILLLILYTYPPTIEHHRPLTSKTELDTIYSTESVEYNENNNEKLINNLGKKCVEQHNNKTCSLYREQPVYRCDNTNTSKTYLDKSQAYKECDSPKTSLFITDGMESCIEDEATVFSAYKNNGNDYTYINTSKRSEQAPSDDDWNHIDSTWDSSGYYGKHVEYITSEGCAPNERRAICKKTLPP